MEKASELYRWVTAMVGSIIAVIEPAIPFVLICTAMVIADCLTAWRLGRRVRVQYPDRASGKFKSCHFERVLFTLIKVYALVLMSYFITVHITAGLIDLTKVSAGAVCFWQACSILENESSCSDARWAKVARKLLIDKTSRHFDINLDEL